MNKKGLTLMELVVVMVIIGIGALLIAPNMSAWLPSYRLRSAARDIASAMRNAQMKAVSTNLVYRVSFTQNPPSYIVQYENPPGSGTWVDDGRSQTLPTGISIPSVTFPGSNAQFNSNSTASAGNVRLRNARGTERRVEVASTTGRIRIIQ
jgi:prepilin-type N-terminal cleavage/methylation domain-containing protein